MNRISIFISGVLLLMFLAACGTSANTIRLKSQSERADVFSEVQDTGTTSAGYAHVIVRANIKTHLEGYYIGESKDSAHGKETYPFLINIDGQAVLWNVKGENKVLPEYLDGKTNSDPEAGQGMKYVLEKKIKLTAGTHTIFFGLPDEPYYTTTEIYVKERGLYVIEFKPVYRSKPYPTRIPNFLQGIDKYEIFMTEVNASSISKE